MLKKGRKLSSELGLEPVNFRLGPWPVGDAQGMQIAIEMLRASQQQGRNSADYVQFESIRKLRSSYFNLYESGPDGCKKTLAMKGGNAKALALTSSPTDSKLFQMFAKGCESRMGKLVMQELALPFEALCDILLDMKSELLSGEISPERKRLLIMGGASFVALFAGALRGGEVLMAESSEFVKLIHKGKVHPEFPHVVVPLMGRFKNETGERNVLLAFVNVTKAGLPVRWWLELLARVLVMERKHKVVGPAFCNEDGTVLERYKLNELLHEGLEKVQLTKPHILDPSIKVEERMSIHRSFRRGATTRATEQGLPEPLLNLNNRWRKVQQKKGALPSLPMSQLYLEISQALGSKLAFSRIL